MWWEGDGDSSLARPHAGAARRRGRPIERSLTFLPINAHKQWRIPDFAVTTDDPKRFSEHFTVGTYPW